MIIRLLLAVALWNAAVTQAELKLRFIQIWFRHGERTPTNYMFFPTDQVTIANFSQLPSKPGELTKRGLQQEYYLGQKIRAKYGDFLGDYDSGKVRIMAGEDNRTIASGQAMLAGLYPPPQGKEFHEGLAWQPVPIHTRNDLDEVTFGIIGSCPGLEEIIYKNPAYSNILNSVDPVLLEFLRNKTGLPIPDPYEYQNVLDSLKTKQSINSPDLPLPSWALPIADQLRNLSTAVHDQMSKILNETSGGLHADYLLSAIEEQALRLPERKAYIISGHDTNIFVLGAFFHVRGLIEDLCEYGAHLAVEVYEDTLLKKTGAPTADNLVVRMFYSYDLNTTVPEELSIPFCEAPCRVGQLKKLADGRRWTTPRWRTYCQRGIDVGDTLAADVDAASNGVLTGALLIAVALLVLTSVILLYLTCSYRRQLEQLKNPETYPLLQ